MSDFIGRGWNFPPKLNSRGGIALISEEEKVAQSIAIMPVVGSESVNSVSGVSWSTM